MIVLGKYREIYNDDSLLSVFDNISEQENKYKEKY